MLWAKSNRVRSLALRIALGALFAVVGVSASLAQSEPPLNVPPGGPPPQSPSAIPFQSWLFYPSINTFSTYSDNLFQSPQSRISAWGFGISPSLTAEWSNGIHTSTLYGNIERRVYPTENEVNATDEQATVTQKYQPLRDLTFTAQVDYTHKTLSNSLEDSIPSGISAPATIHLPNGDTQLPDGTIISPSGEVVGQANPALSVSGLSLINPYDQFTGTASVNKIFNHGVLTLSTSVARKDYETEATKDNTAKTFRENAAVWLGPVFYTYSEGSFTMRSNTLPTPDSTAYRIVAGVGTRQFGLFRVSSYFGHQGTQQSGSAGGAVYGGKITYYPVPDLTISATIDETINISSQTSPSTEALTLPTDIPTQVPISSSTRVTATALQSSYTISPQWTAGGHLSFSRFEFVDTQKLNNVWLADATLKYDIWRNMTLSWEYQFASIMSNVALTSTKRNLIVMSALYKF
jgi:hypothetical protein